MRIATLFDSALETRVRHLESILAELVGAVHFGVRRGNPGVILGPSSSIYRQAVIALGDGYPIPEPYVADNATRYHITTPLGQTPPSENQAAAIKRRREKGGRS